MCVSVCAVCACIFVTSDSVCVCVFAGVFLFHWCSTGGKGAGNMNIADVIRHSTDREDQMLRGKKKKECNL